MENVKNDLDYARDRLRRCVAFELACGQDAVYNAALSVLRELGVFGNWDAWELTNRPVNLEELEDLVFSVIYEDC